jgi:UDP-3-O-[3-hydroxymyristoyl] N-acetylglucosamine deacetylase
VGLISGKPVTVVLAQAKQGQGIQFVFASTGAVLPANDAFIIDTQRGVTLMHPETKQRLSIVEHFLAAVSMSGFTDITATLHGEAPELPLLDGSALPWYEAILSTWGTPQSSANPMSYTIRPLARSVFMSGSTLKTAMYALPAEQFSITYTLDYRHSGFQSDWVTWQGRTDATVSVPALLSAQTFGLVAELPALHAKGLALGVTLENTLGLCADGTYTRALKYPKEPFYHKMLDLVGDFHLCGVPVDSLKNIAIVAVNAGHTSHITFARQLKAMLIVQ